MKCRYSVTFEFIARPPVTHRGIVEGWTASTCTRRAVEDAQKALTPVAWSSMVCVLLERLDTTAAEDSEVSEVAELVP